MVTNSIGNSPHVKESDLINEPIIISGSKRASPGCSVSSPCRQSPSINAVNGHLVYVRRKYESELGKNPACDITSTNADPILRLGSSNMSMSGKPSIPLSSCNSKELKDLQWEERYHQLQLLLKKLDQSSQEDYLYVLRLLSSVELSGHAVELEKRSIQLSLEEAKELQRVRVLNILGQPMKNSKASLTHQDQLEK